MGTDSVIDSERLYLSLPQEAGGTLIGEHRLEGKGDT
jgi:hypothetical protein